MSGFDETYQENISALLDGELSEREVRELCARMETNPESRAVFQAFSAIEDALPDAFPEIPAGLHGHILSGVRAAGAQRTSRDSRRAENAPRQTERRVSPRKLRTALIAAACLALIVTGAALSGRFFRMGRADAGSTASSESLSGGAARTADAGAGAYQYGLEDGVALDTAGAEEEAAEDAPAAAPAPAADDAAPDTSVAEEEGQRLDGFASFAVLVDGETYEGEDAVAVVDDFFNSGNTGKVLNLSVAFPGGEAYSVQLWYRGGKAVCSLNEDGVEVGSLEELLAYFRV